jgi:hypothetical protein
MMPPAENNKANDPRLRSNSRITEVLIRENLGSDFSQNSKIKKDLSRSDWYNSMNTK